jgi:hypothetical protein
MTDVTVTGPGNTGVCLRVISLACSARTDPR